MSALGYTITLYWCGEHRPDGLDGVEPMTSDEATGARCEECGIDLHGREADWAPERPSETADYPPMDEHAGIYDLEDNGG